MSRNYLVCLSLIFTSITSHAMIMRFSQVSPQIYRGSQPENMADYAVLKKLGVKTLVNLRWDGQSEAAVAKQLGFDFFLFPMNAMRTPTDELVNQALVIINDPNHQPVFVHCVKGKDRTGLIIALHRMLYEKWAPQKAYNEMIGFGFNRVWLPLLYYFHKRAFYLSPTGLHILSPLVDPTAAGN